MLRKGQLGHSSGFAASLLYPGAPLHVSPLPLPAAFFQPAASLPRSSAITFHCLQVSFSCICLPVIYIASDISVVPCCHTWVHFIVVSDRCCNRVYFRCQEAVCTLLLLTYFYSSLQCLKSVPFSTSYRFVALVIRLSLPALCFFLQLLKLGRQIGVDLNSLLWVRFDLHETRAIYTWDFTRHDTQLTDVKTEATKLNRTS